MLEKKIEIVTYSEFLKIQNKNKFELFASLNEMEILANYKYRHAIKILCNDRMIYGLKKE
ncbi:hypothetical protein RAK27_19460 [Carnobacterium maltaromaticum]|uniref:Uncharacterized protein n=1 Tax=Carnobacterium maltaromaticum TaxID=2751 RepID=A0AAW9K4V3_CARML|nr:hypothetical protein [Carnobacterium maltaromaticum]MDZ5760826.1 hypothetical protein [Carnobacterium maltaromaticum]